MMLSKPLIENISRIGSDNEQTANLPPCRLIDFTTNRIARRPALLMYVSVSAIEDDGPVILLDRSFQAQLEFARVGAVYSIFTGHHYQRAHPTRSVLISIG